LIHLQLRLAWIYGLLRKFLNLVHIGDLVDWLRILLGSVVLVWPLFLPLISTLFISVVHLLLLRLFGSVSLLVAQPNKWRDSRLPSQSRLRSAFFWVITHRTVVIPYWLFGTTYLSYPQGSKNLEDGNDMLSRNVGTELLPYTAQYSRTAQFSSDTVVSESYGSLQPIRIASKIVMYIEDAMAADICT
jgi:hypothetical protein